MKKLIDGLKSAKDRVNALEKKVGSETRSKSTKLLRIIDVPLGVRVRFLFVCISMYSSVHTCEGVGINSGPGDQGLGDSPVFGSFTLQNLNSASSFAYPIHFLPSRCFTRCLSIRNYKRLRKGEAIHTLNNEHTSLLLHLSTEIK